MTFAASRHTATDKQIGKMRGLAGALGEGSTLLLAMARDERVRSMRTHPKLLGHPVTDDLAELSMNEASAIISSLAEAVAEEVAATAGPEDDPTEDTPLQQMFREELMAVVQTSGGDYIHTRPVGVEGNKLQIVRRVV
jgi:hypothetical protein